MDSFWSGPDTCESLFDVHFTVQEPTRGGYPITYAALYVNEEPYDSWEIHTPFFDQYISDIPAECGEHVGLELVPMNPVSVEPIVVATTYFTTPTPPPPVGEDVLCAYVDAEYECTCDQLGTCIDCDVYIIWEDDKGALKQR